MEFCGVAVGFCKLWCVDVMIFAYNLLNDFVCLDMFVVFATVIDSLS